MDKEQDEKELLQDKQKRLDAESQPLMAPLLSQPLAQLMESRPLAQLPAMTLQK